MSDIDDLISNYRAAFYQANGYDPAFIRYHRGWVTVRLRHGTFPAKYRKATLADMTQRLLEREPHCQPARAASGTSTPSPCP